MNKKILGIFILMVLIGISFLPCLKSIESSFSDTIIVPDDYPIIQEAIDNANPGDSVFVRSGTYNENLIIDRTIILTGENKNNTIINGNESGDVVIVSADYVYITNFSIQNSGSVKYQTTAGINLCSNSSNIFDNIISNNSVGIFLNLSSNHTIFKNTFFNCGLSGEGSNKNTINNNTVNGKPLVYMEEKTGNVIKDAGQVILVNCDNITIKDQEISNTSFGITLVDTDNCLISNNIISYQGIGISLLFSSNNTILNNTILNGNATITLFFCNNNTIMENNIFNNDAGPILYYSNNNIISGNTINLNHLGYGLLLGYYGGSSNNNTITGNTISSSNWSGIALGASKNNSILNNAIRSNNGNGINLYYSNCNNIASNGIILNNHSGIYLNSSKCNTITYNNISDHHYGIYLPSASNFNKIWQNNFIKNNVHAFFRDSFFNRWKNNYWDNWIGFGPKLIVGQISLPYRSLKTIPWINFDWHPAKEPYDI